MPPASIIIAPMIRRTTKPMPGTWAAAAGMSRQVLAPAANHGVRGLELRRPVGAGGRGADPKQVAVDLVDAFDLGRAVAEIDPLRIGRLVEGESPLASAAVDTEAVAF